MKWSDHKRDVLRDIKKAGITDKTAIKYILLIERKVCTINNAYARGLSSEWISMNVCTPKADVAMEALGNDSYTYYPRKAPYRAEWEAYCKASGTALSWNLEEVM